MVVPEGVPDSKIVRCRHGEGSKFTESQSTTAVGGMEPACGGLKNLPVPSRSPRKNTKKEFIEKSEKKP